MARWILWLMVFGFSINLSGQDRENFLQNLNVNEWVEIEGVPQEDGSILALEIKVLYGELENDDYEVNGIVGNVSSEDKRISILALTIFFDQETEYDDKYNAIKSFSDISSGQCVEAEGSVLSDGTFLAKEIGLKKPKKGEENIFEWRGKVQSVEAANNRFEMLGHTVIISPETIIKSLVH